MRAGATLFPRSCTIRVVRGETPTTQCLQDAVLQCPLRARGGCDQIGKDDGKELVGKVDTGRKAK
jgi:hypothetical protein